MCVNRGPGTLESDISLKLYMPIYGLFFFSFDYIPVHDKRSFETSGLLPDVYSVCFRIMFPESLTQF